MSKLVYFNLDQQINELVIKELFKITPKNDKNLLVFPNAYILS